jgi:hypothetical protein
VLKQEPNGKKPFLAHIFKYSLAAQFPLKVDDLDTFCKKIEVYNGKMAEMKQNFRSPVCYNNTAFTQKIHGGVLSYLLFERPIGGSKLSDICVPNCSKQRICRYMLKDFAKGWLTSKIYSQNSTDPFEVDFQLAQNGFFYGKAPGQPKEDNLNHFISLPYPKFFAPDNVLNEGGWTNLTQIMREVQNKQLMTGFARFMINFYKGLDNTTDLAPPSPEDNFDPTAFQFKNLTDVYLIMNTKPDGNFTKFKADKYFGVTPDYIESLKAFMDKTLTIQKAIEEMSKKLKDSFFEFIFKAANFDTDNKMQFDSLASMLKHKFLDIKLELNEVRSDTSFEK